MPDGEDTDAKCDLPDLRHFLNADPNPKFLIPIHKTEAISFQMLFCNTALENDTVLSDMILENSRESMRFRSWCQAIAGFKEEFAYAERFWVAFIIQDRWKCIRSSSRHALATVTRLEWAETTAEIAKKRKDAEDAQLRLSSMHTMMEMSDIGVLEVTPQGSIIRANVSRPSASILDLRLIA